jgi:uncharacterized LabA/DUF88 family protein
MYTEEMAQAFHQITAPDGFSVDLYDAEQWLTIVIDPNKLVGKTQQQLQDIASYINSVKLALENVGAIVLISRDALGE